MARLAVAAALRGRDSDSENEPLDLELDDCRLRFVPPVDQTPLPGQEAAMAHLGALLPARRIEGVAASPAYGPNGREASRIRRAGGPRRLASPAGLFDESRVGPRLRELSLWH